MASDEEDETGAQEDYIDIQPPPPDQEEYIDVPSPQPQEVKCLLLHQSKYINMTCLYTCTHINMARNHWPQIQYNLEFEVSSPTIGR